MFHLFWNCCGGAGVNAYVQSRKGIGHGLATAPNVVIFICALLFVAWPLCSIAATREQLKCVLMIGAYSEMLPSTVESSTAIMTPSMRSATFCWAS
jgi:hypothetical protein